MGYKIVEPAWGHYILEEYKLTQTAAGGFAVADAQNKPEIGKIILVGKNAIHESGTEVLPQFEVDDIIAYKPYTGKTVTLNHKNYTAVAFADAICKIKEEK